MKALRLLVAIALISGVSSVTALAGEHTDKVNEQQAGYRLQIQRAQHYIDYAKQQGLSEADESIERANEIVVKSQEGISKAAANMAVAIQKDKEAAQKEREQRELINKLFGVKLEEENKATDNTNNGTQTTPQKQVKLEGKLAQLQIADANYKKLKKIALDLGISRIEDIPMDVIKANGLYNYTYDLIKKEDIPLNEQWEREEAKYYLIGDDLIEFESQFK